MLHLYALQLARSTYPTLVHGQESVAWEEKAPHRTDVHHQSRKELFALRRNVEAADTTAIERSRLRDVCEPPFPARSESGGEEAPLCLYRPPAVPLRMHFDDGAEVNVIDQSFAIASVTFRDAIGRGSREAVRRHRTRGTALVRLPCRSVYLSPFGAVTRGNTERSRSLQ